MIAARSSRYLRSRSFTRSDKVSKSCGLLRPCRLLATAATVPDEAARALTKASPLRRRQQNQGGTMPPGYQAEIGDLATFEIPSYVSCSTEDVALGKAMVAAWRKDGILQVRMDVESANIASEAFKTSQAFFALPPSEKASCVDDQSFAGYVASGEEITDGVADYSEIFTVTKDLPLSDPRVVARWPCHGPCPWPNEAMQRIIQRYMSCLSEYGDRILRLIALGLDLADPNTLTNLTSDGWHHLRILRFPKTGDENGKGRKGRGIGSHTDYGLLVIAAQNDVGGLFVRRPADNEQYQNWIKSTAGLTEDDEKWVYVPPHDGVFTVLPGTWMLINTPKVSPKRIQTDSMCRRHDAALDQQLSPSYFAQGRHEHS